MRWGVPSRWARRRFDLGAGEDDGESFGALGGFDAVEGGHLDAEDVAVEEQEGVAGDVLRGGGDVLLDGEVCEVVADVGGSECGGVASAVEVDEALDGGEVGVLGVEAEVFEPEDGARLFQEGVDAVHGVSFCGIMVSSVGRSPVALHGPALLRRSVRPCGIIPQRRHFSASWRLVIPRGRTGIAGLTRRGSDYTALMRQNVAIIGCYAASVRYSNKLGRVERRRGGGAEEVTVLIAIVLLVLFGCALGIYAAWRDSPQRLRGVLIAVGLTLILARYPGCPCYGLRLRRPRGCPDESSAYRS